MKPSALPPRYCGDADFAYDAAVAGDDGGEDAEAGFAEHRE